VTGYSTTLGNGTVVQMKNYNRVGVCRLEADMSLAANYNWMLYNNSTNIVTCKNPALSLYYTKVAGQMIMPTPPTATCNSPCAYNPDAPYVQYTLQTPASVPNTVPYTTGPAVISGFLD